MVSTAQGQSAFYLLHTIPTTGKQEYTVPTTGMRGRKGEKDSGREVRIETEGEGGRDIVGLLGI